MIFLGINIYLIILKMANNLVRQFYKIKVYYPRTTHLFSFFGRGTSLATHSPNSLESVPEAVVHAGSVVLYSDFSAA